MIKASFAPVVHSGDDVSVHGVDLRPNDAVEAACLALLDPEERARAARFKVAAPRRQFVVTRGALRLLLASHVGYEPEALTLAAGRHGKPYLVVDGAPSELAFNVSHSADRALIAIGRGPIGIDIELLGREADFDLVAKGVFTQAEQKALRQRAGAERRALFFRLWTQKEALIKAKGCGFAYPPRQFGLPDALVGGERRAAFSFPGEAAVWQVTDLSEGDYAAALAQASS
jgi:4'-phosphopantetheinyl transferase